MTDTNDCCPKFDPAPWDGKTIEWKDKKFVKVKVFTLFHIPVNLGSAMAKLDAKIKAAGIQIPDFMGIADCSSKWSMDIYVAVDKELPDAENVALSGRFIFKAYEGKFSELGKWHKDFAAYAKDRNLSVKKKYMWFTTCQKCVKKHGKNYVVIVGELA